MNGTFNQTLGNGLMDALSPSRFDAGKNNIFFLLRSENKCECSWRKPWMGVQYIRIMGLI